MIGQNIPAPPAAAGIGGSTGSVDNAILRADGTGGATLQTSGLVAEDAIVSFTSITGDALTDVITATGSAFTDGQPVRFTALTGGSGLNTTTNYFVREASGATFKVETSIGGGAINFTTNITAGTLLTGHSVQANVTLSENTTETNSALVLSPKGTGALIAQKPNGGTGGGNSRGANAVDFQMFRAANTRVASGQESVICGGGDNTASAYYSSVVGGNTNIASGQGGAVVGGFNNQATARESFVGGGRDSRATGVYSFVCGGNLALADRTGQYAHAIGQFANRGDAQNARFILRNKTTTNSAVELYLDGSADLLTIPSGKVMFMNIKVVGVRSDGSTVASYERQYAAKNVAGTSSEVFAPVTIGTDLASGTTLEVATVDAGDYIRIRPTGVASQTWRWVASVDAVEVAYGT